MHAFGGSSLQLSTQKANVQQRASIRKYKGLADLQAIGEDTRHRGGGGSFFEGPPYYSNPPATLETRAR